MLLRRKAIEIERRKKGGCCSVVCVGGGGLGRGESVFSIHDGFIQLDEDGGSVGELRGRYCVGGDSSRET